MVQFLVIQGWQRFYFFSLTQGVSGKKVIIACITYQQNWGRCSYLQGDRQASVGWDHLESQHWERWSRVEIGSFGPPGAA